MYPILKNFQNFAIAKITSYFFPTPLIYLTFLDQSNFLDTSVTTVYIIWVPFLLLSTVTKRHVRNTSDSCLK